MNNKQKTLEERAYEAYPPYTTMGGFLVGDNDCNAPLRTAYIAGVIDQQHIDKELIANLRTEFLEKASLFLSDRLFPSVKVIKGDQIDVINRDDLIKELCLHFNEYALWNPIR